MRRGFFPLAVGFLVLAGGPLAAQPKGRDFDSPARNGWLSSLSEGKAEAKKTGKPLMAVVRCVP